MALIMYLTKAPRYKNIMTDEYETIPRKDIELIEKYFNWGKAREEGKSKSNTLQEWCGVLENQLPHKYILNYYREFFTEKKVYTECIGEVKHHGIFDQIGRIVKANQIFNWFIKNVMSNDVSNKYYEVTKDQLQNLLDVCITIKNNITILNDDEYTVNEDVAKEILPLLKTQGYFFGTSSYGIVYAKQVLNTIDVITNILETTDFEKETIYFNAIW
jgi:hypothetical protein